MKFLPSCQRRPVMRQWRRRRRRLLWRQLLLSVCLLVCRVSDSFFSLAGQLNCLTSRRPRSHTRLAPHKHSCRGQWTVIGSACALGSPTTPPTPPSDGTLSGALEQAGGRGAAMAVIGPWPQPRCCVGFLALSMSWRKRLQLNPYQELWNKIPPNVWSIDANVADFITIDSNS